MDLISQSISWPTATESTWIDDSEKLQEVFFKNPSVSSLKLVLPIAFKLSVKPGKRTIHYPTNRKKTPNNGIILSQSHTGMILKHPMLDKTATCDFELSKVSDILKETANPNRFILKVDFMEVEFQQNLGNSTIGFSQKLPPVSFKGELDENLATIDIPIEPQLHSDAVILKYYFSDFTKIRERLNDFIRACSVFYTVYCRQPSLAEKEDGSLEVKWS